ncbi:MAG: ABC transporter permease [Chromatiales bacterium]|jgi:general nucleoside transport system permease protein|nr:ABC transporter permease [Chromatiales bacterium]
MLYLTPVLAVALTILAGMIMFAALGKEPVEAIGLIFIEPFKSPFSRAELLVKGTPLVLIAIGLSLGFRANVWNIGAEGQFTVGALAGGAVALFFYEVEGVWLLPLMCFAGIAAGAAWAGIPAYLRIRFNANEILVSLMLTYVAILLLGAMVNGPLRDPDGFNFPESRLFHDAAIFPLLIPGTRAHVGTLAALAAVVAAFIVLERHLIGVQIKLFGQAPRAARFAGFSEAKVIAGCLLASGALAGLAGVFEAAGPIGQLVPSIPVGYGFTAIIVAFLGRLHPLGILLAGAVMALTYIGGESAQMALKLPSAVTSVFQGMLLFFLLGVDLLVGYRIRFARAAPRRVEREGH